MLGEIEGGRRKGRQRTRWLDGITNSQSLLKLMSTESVMPSNHLVLCRPFLLPPSISPSIRVFSDESALHIKWPKYWSFSFSLSSGYSGLISFTMDQLDLLAVQGTLKSLLQHHSSKASILQRSALSFLYSPTLTSIYDHWKNHSLVGKVMPAFQCAVQVGHSFSPKEQVSFNFTLAVTICSDFGAPQKN